LLPALAMLCACRVAGQTASEAAPSAAGVPQIVSAQPVNQQPVYQQIVNQPIEASQSQQALPEAPEPQHQKAEQELNQEEHQRVLGVIPNFNSISDPNAPPLTPKQKLHLAFRSATDPFQFVAAGIDAGLSQAEDDFPGYGLGAQGYAKRFGAAYTDGFDSTMLGNGILPILLHEDPRYFRKGTGSVARRLAYTVSTTFWCKRDNGSWGPNYANVVGNLAAGGISNLYYPAGDRGAALTFERAFTDAAEGLFGALVTEFGPDVATRLHKKKNQSGTASGSN
jgi:hypothetical protein